MKKNIFINYDLLAFDLPTRGGRKSIVSNSGDDQHITKQRFFHPDILPYKLVGIKKLLKIQKH